MPIGYIYKILNTKNNKFLIGSTNNPKIRKINHFSNCRCNKHCNSKFQNSWNKYGEQSFKFQIIEEVYQIENLLKREQYWIDTYWNSGLLLNVEPIAGKPPIRNRPHTQETKNKISQTKKKDSQNISDKLRKRIWTEESKEKLRRVNLGKKYSMESKIKMSQSQYNWLKHNKPPMLGKIHSNETRQKISLAQIGRKRSNATKHKQSYSMKLYWQRKKLCQI